MSLGSGCRPLVLESQTKAPQVSVHAVLLAHTQVWVTAGYCGLRFPSPPALFYYLRARLRLTANIMSPFAQ